MCSTYKHGNGLTIMGNYISDYTKPIRLIRVLEGFLGHDVNAIAVGNNSIDDAMGEMLRNSDHVVGDLARVTDGTFAIVRGLNADDVPSGCVGVRLAVGTAVVREDTDLIDVNRTVDSGEMTELDVACAFTIMSKSQVGNVILLRYNEIGIWTNPFMRGNADMFSAYGGILAECRSIVVDLSTHGILSLPYYKFRNLNECDGYMDDQVNARIDVASKVEFTEKLDGSMIQLRDVSGDGIDVFDGGLLVSSSGSLTSEHMGNARKWIADHKDERFAEMCRDNPDITFVLEYVNPPMDPHVVLYDESRWDMYLTGMRDVHTGELMGHDAISAIAGEYGIRCSKLYGHYDMDTVLGICHEGVPSDQEGFVLNADGFLVKIKLDSFLGVSKMVHSSNTHNTIIRNVAYGLMDDLVSNVPVTHRDGVMRQARVYEDYDRRMSDMVRDAIDNAGKAGDGGARDVAAFVNGNVPKFARGFVFAGIHGRDIPSTFLGRNLGTDSPSFLSRRDFDRNLSDLGEWERAMGR